MPCAVKNGRTPALPSLAGLWYKVRVKLQTHHNIRGKIRKLIHKEEWRERDGCVKLHNIQILNIPKKHSKIRISEIYCIIRMNDFPYPVLWTEHNAA